MILTQAKQGTQERGAYLLGLWVRQSALQRAQLCERERAACNRLSTVHEVLHKLIDCDGLVTPRDTKLDVGHPYLS